MTNAGTCAGVAGARLALDDAKLDVAAMDGERVGVCVGSAFGGMEFYETQTLKNSAAGPKKGMA